MKNTKRLQTEVDNLKRDATSSLQKFDSIKAELERLQSSLDDQYIDLIRLRGHGKKLQGDFDLADDTEVSKVVTDIDKRMRYYRRTDIGNHNNVGHKKSATESSTTICTDDDQTTSASLPAPSPPISGAAIIEQLWNSAKNPNSNPQEARSAIANGASVDARSEKWASDINLYPTPFCEACKNRHYDLIRVLATSVENGGLGCDRNVLNRHRETQLVRACMDGTAHELVKLLIELDCNTELCDERGRSPLLIASENDDVELVKIICNSKKINVNCGDKYGITPLMMAAQNGNEEIVKTLLEKDPSAASATSADGSTALHFACQEIGEGQLACAELLLECEHVNPNAQDSEDRTPLMVAIESNNVKVLVQLLLFDWKIHTEVQCHAQSGKTALFLACDVTARTGGDALILYLLRSGRAKMDATLDNGMNLLMYCAAEGNDVALRCIYNTSYTQFLQLLNSVDDENKTALNHACRRRQFSTAERLVKTGKCDLNIQDNTNSSPLSICCEIGASDIAKLLLDAGADAKWNSSQYSSLTALATDRGQTVIVKLLKEHAAAEQKKREEAERRLEEFYQAERQSRNTISMEIDLMRDHVHAEIVQLLKEHAAAEQKKREEAERRLRKVCHAIEALKQAESQGRNSILIEIDSFHKKFNENEQQARHLSLKHEQEDPKSSLELSIETTFRKATIPGLLTTENRLPIFKHILARKVRHFFPLCSLSLDEFIPRKGLRRELSSVIPPDMQVMPCTVVGPRSEARRAHASVQQALEASRSNSKEAEWKIEAGSLLSNAEKQEAKKQGKKAHSKMLSEVVEQAKKNAKNAVFLIDVYIEFVPEAFAFHCSTIYLREEKETSASLNEVKSQVVAFLRSSVFPTQGVTRLVDFVQTLNVTKQIPRRAVGSSQAPNHDTIYKDVIVEDPDYTSGHDSDSEDSSGAEEEREELKRSADAKHKEVGRAGAPAAPAASDGSEGSSGQPSSKNSHISFEDLGRMNQMQPSEALQKLSSMIEVLDQQGAPQNFPLPWFSLLYFCESSYCRHRLAQWEMLNVNLSLHSRLYDTVLIRLPSEQEQERMNVRFPPFSERRPSIGVGDIVVIHIPSMELILEAPVLAVFPRELGLMANDEVRVSETSNIRQIKDDRRPDDVLMQVVESKIPVNVTFDCPRYTRQCQTLAAAATRGDQWYDLLVNPNSEDVYGLAPTKRALLEHADRFVPEPVKMGTTGVRNRGELSKDQLAVVGFMIQPPQKRHELAVNGPSGTGKTEVLARGILAILEKDPKARILVTSTSHSAVDNLFTRCVSLALDSDAKKFRDKQGRDTFFRKNFFRFYQAHLTPRYVRKHVLPYTNLFPMAAYDELTATSKNKFDEDLAHQMIPSKRAVFTSITAISKLLNWNEHFSHVIIEDAHSVSMCEGFLALDVLDTNHPQYQFVIAGDTEHTRLHVVFPKLRQWLEQSVLATANKNPERFMRLQLEESFRATDELAGVQSAIFYKGKLRAAASTLHHGKEGSQTKTLIQNWSKKNMEGSSSPFQFIHIKGKETTQESDSSSVDNVKERSAMTYSNPEETTCIAAIVASMIQFGISPGSITVLTNFKSQRKAIQQRLDMSHRKNVVRVTCIEEFQGQESDIIIMSMVRNQKDDNFLNKTDLNTSVSRARALAIIVGDGEMVQNANSKAWNNFMSMLKNPETHGMFNYDYETERLIDSKTFDLELSSQKHGLNIKEFKPKSKLEKSILFKEFHRDEILSSPSKYFVGRVRWFDASRLASYVEASDVGRFLVASNRFTAGVDVKIDMSTELGQRKFFCILGDIIAMVVEGMEDRIALLARDEIPTRRVYETTSTCWPFSENYHFGSIYSKKSPYQVGKEARQQQQQYNNNGGGRGRGGRGRGGQQYDNLDQFANQQQIRVSDEDVDAEIMSRCSYQIFDDEEDNIFVNQQYAGLPVCILRYAKLPPILCEVKMKIVIQKNGSKRIYYSAEANPIDTRFPALPFDESEITRLSLLQDGEKNDSKVVRFWCDMIRPPLNDLSNAVQYKGSVNFYRPIRVERSIPITEVPQMKTISLPTSSINQPLPICSPVEKTIQRMINANINSSLDVQFLNIASLNSYVGFSLSLSESRTKEQHDDDEFGNNELALPSDKCTNDSSSSSIKNLNGDLRVGIHIPIVADIDVENNLIRNGVNIPSAHRVPPPSGAYVEVVSIYTEISVRQQEQSFNVGGTHFQVERLTRFQVSSTLPEPLKKLSDKIDDHRKRLSAEAKIASYFGDHCAARELSQVLPSQALLTRKSMRQNLASGVDFYEMEWFVPTLEVREAHGGGGKQCFVHVYGDNVDSGFNIETRACQPFSSLGSLAVQRQMMIVSKIRSAMDAVELDQHEKHFLRNTRELAAWLNGLTLVRSAEEFE